MVVALQFCCLMWEICLFILMGKNVSVIASYRVDHSLPVGFIQKLSPPMNLVLDKLNRNVVND